MRGTKTKQISKIVPLLVATILGCATASAAEPRVIFLVRHAERADTAARPQHDPDLSRRGRNRATALAKTLQHAGISAIFVSEYKRTQQTANGIARSLGLIPQIVPAKETAALAKRLRRGSGRALVVAHSNTIPVIIRALGIRSAVTLGENDYDDLFLVILGQRPQLIRLHYR